MKIVDIQERVASIASPIRNAYIDFRRMAVSVAVVVTDVIRDGKPVVGYGFNSNGGYRTVKIKIGGAALAEDLERIESVLSLVSGGDRLAVDANGRFDLDTALCAPGGAKKVESGGYVVNCRGMAPRAYCLGRTAG